MGKLDDYLAVYDDYKKIYGVKFAVFYQIGKFHELYGVDNALEKLGNVTEIANLLNIKETRVDSSRLENNRENPQMAGFNSVSLDRNVDLLTDQGYSVVVVNQKPDTSPIVREVAFIASPATNLRGGQNDPYIVSIYISQEWNKGRHLPLLYIGMAAFDISTGRCYTMESNSLPGDLSRAEDDLNRFLQTYAPVEVLLHVDPGATLVDAEKLITGWGYRNAWTASQELKPIVYLNIDHLERPSHVEASLAGFYPPAVCKHLNAVEYVGLTAMPNALKAFVYLLRFCKNHNRELNGLPAPKQHEDEESLILDTNCLLQLAILDSFYAQQKRDTVFSHISGHVMTPMGRRLMRERLTNPITNVDRLNARYAAIEQMGGDTGIPRERPVVCSLKPRHGDMGTAMGIKPFRLYEYVRKSLTGMRDLDRFHRKITIGTLTPAEFYFLSQAYTAFFQFLTAVSPTFDHFLPSLQVIRDRTKAIDLEEAGKCICWENLTGSIFVRGYHADLDALVESIEKDKQRVAQAGRTFSNFVQTDSEACRYVVADDTCYFTLSKTAWTKFKKGFQPVPEWNLGSLADLHVDDRNKSNVKFSLVELTKLDQEYRSKLSQLRSMTHTLFQTFLSSFEPYLADLDRITGNLAELDLNQALYTLHIEGGYCRPELDSGKKAYVVAEGLRHPVIERRCNYVAQDIALGQPGQTDGILLYGVNQTGKSCTMKSLGIAVILAQAGFYVPAKRFRYCPYRTIMTRILSQDNMANGLSTFAVEMVELRSILTRCHRQTLILGDEVCHGTESASAVSLVVAAVAHMAEQQASFIFATHLHELSQMEEILACTNVAQYHLSVNFEGDKIIYDRYMKPGSGLGRYGIEVARFLKLPPEVLHRAYTIRNKYYATPETLSTSRYNANFILHKCGICGAPAKDTHHILFQSESNAKDLIDNRISKNNIGNLVGLCGTHHDMVHHPGKDELVIFGYLPGGELNYAIRPRLSTLNGRDIPI